MNASIRKLGPWLAVFVTATACTPPRPSGDLKSEPVLVGGALNGVAAFWPAQGPAPIAFGQAENLTPDDEVSGAVRVVLPHPTDANVMYLAAVNGGIWRTDNATAPSPTWIPLTDGQRSLSIGALAMDPGNPGRLLAGFGAYSSFGRISGEVGGLLLTADGGTSWTALRPAALSRRSISSVEIRGDTLLVGSDSGAGGLFRSTDAGATFTAISGTGGLPAGRISELVRDRSSATRYYAAVLGAGIFRSDDTGLSWTDVSRNDASPGGLQQTVTAAGNNRVRLATGNDGRLYVAVVVSGNPSYIGFTDDQGASWTAMDIPRTEAPHASTTISNASNTSPIVITTVGNHGLRLGDGNLFVRISGVLGNTAANGDFRVRPVLATDPPNQFTLLGSAGNGAYAGGGSWLEFDGLTPNPQPGDQGSIHLSMTVDPTDSGIVYLGGDRQDFPNMLGAANFSGRLFRGNTAVAPTGAIPSPQWAHLTHSNAVAAIPTGGTASDSAPHADSRSLAVDAAGNLIEGSDGGITRRTSPRSNTGDWFSINGNLQITELHDIAFDPVSSMLVGGAQDTGSPLQFVPGGLTWFEFTQGDGGDTQVDPTSAGAGRSIRYTSNQNLGGARRTTFDSSGIPISSVLLGLNTGGAPRPQVRFLTPLELNRANPVRLVIGFNDAVWESSDQGDNITSLGAGTGGAIAMAYGHPANAEILWVSTGGTVLVRNVAGGALAPTAATFPGLAALDIALDAVDPATAYVVGLDAAGAPAVFRATGTGDTWTDVTGDLTVLDPGRLRTLAFVPGTPDKIFVGADRGVFVTSTASLGFWNRVSKTLPNALVMDMDYAAGTDTLYIGTMGRGAWSLAGASAVDLPPAARCQDVTVPADNMCRGTATPAQVNDASFDPEGAAVSLGPLSPAPPYPLGVTPVSLAMSSPGGDESCQARVTVVDVTAPSITAPPARTITVCLNANIGQPSTSDNCGPVTVTSDAPAKFPLGATTVTWTARDPAGNTRTATQRVTAVLGDDRSCCPTGTTIREGTSGRDTLRGTAGSDCLLGKGGDDIIEGLAGNDFISGGEGSDQVTGGFGNDLVNGGGGNDVIDGQDGDDVIDGQAGIDTCAGGPGRNVVMCEVASGG
jgi:photosystem II stability/assembly factor-like uncharacterized protein